MAEYDEREYFSDTPEEIAKREAQEAMRRIARTEIRRVQTGAADADIAEDIAREQAENEAIQKKERPLWMKLLAGSITGEIVIFSEFVSKLSRFLLCLVMIFILSCAVISWSFKVEIEYINLKKEVALLKERAIRTKEECYRHSSHSAIVRKLENRGIAIKDPQTQPKTLK